MYLVSANIEPCLTPERPVAEAGADPEAMSPLIKSARLKNGRKMVLVHRLAAKMVILILTLMLLAGRRCFGRATSGRTTGT